MILNEWLTSLLFFFPPLLLPSSPSSLLFLFPPLLLPSSPASLRLQRDHSAFTRARAIYRSGEHRLGGELQKSHFGCCVSGISPETAEFMLSAQPMQTFATVKSTRVFCARTGFTCRSERTGRDKKGDEQTAQLLTLGVLLSPDIVREAQPLACLRPCVIIAGMLKVPRRKGGISRTFSCKKKKCGSLSREAVFPPSSYSGCRFPLRCRQREMECRKLECERRERVLAVLAEAGLRGGGGGGGRQSDALCSAERRRGNSVHPPWTHLRVHFHQLPVEFNLLSEYFATNHRQTATPKALRITEN